MQSVGIARVLGIIFWIDLAIGNENTYSAIQNYQSLNWARQLDNFELSGSDWGFLESRQERMDW